MRFSWRQFICQFVCVCALGAVLQARATEVAGVEFPERIEVQGTTLRLNGAGIRYKAIFKVYAAGLYAPRKIGSLEELLKAPGPKRLAITTLREIDADELGKLFARGMEDNMDRAAFAQLVPGILRMSQIFSIHKKLLPGDSFAMDWIPGKGLIITVKGQPQGEPFREPEFYAALMAIWLGRSPADWQLKSDLLGQKS